MTDNRPPMSHTPEQTALLMALRQLLRPLADLAVSRGLPYLALDELVRQAMVEAAGAQQSHLPAHGKVSRISTATGLSRREVARLLESATQPCTPPRWLAGEVFARWTSDPMYAPVIEAAEAEALVWALERGSRSGRVAQQFARDYAGRSPEGPPTATARPRIADIAGLSDGAEI